MPCPFSGQVVDDHLKGILLLIDTARFCLDPLMAVQPIGIAHLIPPRSWKSVPSRCATTGSGQPSPVCHSIHLSQVPSGEYSKLPGVPSTLLRSRVKPASRIWDPVRRSSK